MDVDFERQRLTVGNWSRRVTSLRRRTGDEEFIAELGLRKGVNVSIEGELGGTEVFIELWSGAADDESLGIAVVARGGRPVALAQVPMCDCGEIGCSNAGRQYSLTVPVEELAAAVESLADLPDAPFPKTKEHLWRDATWGDLEGA